MAEKKKSGVWFGIVVVALILALGVEAYLYFFPARPRIAQRAIKDEPITSFGTKTAPIQIEFFAPLALEWHQKTIGLLHDYDKKHPGRIYVSLLPMGNDEAEKIAKARGHTCAYIYINGKDEFTLPNGKHALLEQRPNNGDGSSYNSEDVITVLDNLKLPAA